MQPSWIDKEQYPFTSRFLEVPAGNLHYLDEGLGPTLLFVHGTPTWSFLWRKQIKEMSKVFRCVAVDYLGFGLSDKPQEFSYSLQDHRRNMSLLVQHLNLENITLIVHDFGGPIGIGWAAQNPNKVAKLVVLNSWMWPLTEEKSMMQASKLFSSTLGKFFYQNLNFSPKVLLPKAFFQKKTLTKEIHRHYLEPFKNRKERKGPWHFAKALAGETRYFTEVYRQKEVLQEKPALIIWGTRDPLIPASFLEKWQKTLPNTKVVRLETGHFVQEEAPDKVTKAIWEFVGTL